MITEDLIKSFFKGECSEQEQREVQSWLTQPENQEKAQAILKASWENASDQEPVVPFDKETLLQGIRSKINIPDQPAKPKRERISDRQPLGYPSRKRSWRSVTIFACLILFFVAGYFMMPQPDEVSEAQIAQVTKTVPRGYRKSIKLSDGSRITLNSESTITFDQDFGKENRTVHLTGEAFFEVAHDKSKPFIVIAKGLKTTALGTSFNINAYSGNITSISLATGKVKVEQNETDTTDTGNTQMILTPGQQAVWVNDQTGLIKREFDSNLTLSWKNNIIYFDNTPLDQMVSILEKWYDVKISVKGNTKLLKDTGTGRFENTSLEHVLSSLGYSMSFTYQINNKEIQLKLNEE